MSYPSAFLQLIEVRFPGSTGVAPTVIAKRQVDKRFAEATGRAMKDRVVPISNRLLETWAKVLGTYADVLRQIFAESDYEFTKGRVREPWGAS